MKKRNLALLALAGIAILGLSRAGGLPLRGGARVVIENKHTTDISGARIEADYSNTFEMSFIICDWAVLKQNQAYECQIPPEKDFQNTKMKFTGRFTLIIPSGKFDFQLENLSTIMRSENGITVQIIDMSKPAKITIITILPITQIPNPKVIIENNNGYFYDAEIMAIYSIQDKYTYPYLACNWYVIEPNKTYECLIPSAREIGNYTGKFSGEFYFQNRSIAKFKYKLENLTLIREFNYGIHVRFIDITKPAKITILNP